MKNERTLCDRTELLYEKDAYLQEFEAKVIGCVPYEELRRSKEKNIDIITHKDDKSHTDSIDYADSFEGWFGVELSSTAFFPEGGGQLSDTGLIELFPVVDVFKEDGRIFHLVQHEFFEGETVKGALDFKKRFRNMQNHTGEHLICGLIYSLYGYENVGFHLSENLLTVDINGILTSEDFDRVEKMANQAIYENKSIYAVYPRQEDQLEYRSKLELDEEIRVIIIDGYDACACCAPHVKTTAEIGIVKILDYMNHRGGMRFTLQCGESAYETLSQVFRQNKEIMGMLSAKRENCSDAVQRQCSQLKEQYDSTILLKKEITSLYIDKLQNQSLFFTSTLDDVQVRTIINETVLKTRKFVAGFMGQGNHQYRYIIGKGDSCEVNLKQLAKELNETFSGRGGGSDKMVQGSITGEPDRISSFLEAYF